MGHALSNDLKVLLLPHPRQQMRDTARWPPLMRETLDMENVAREAAGSSARTSRSEDPGGRAWKCRGRDGAMDLYKLFAADWEASLRSQGGV